MSEQEYHHDPELDPIFGAGLHDPEVGRRICEVVGADNLTHAAQLCLQLTEKRDEVIARKKYIMEGKKE